MPIQHDPQTITVTAPGGVVNLPTISPATLYTIQGAVTLTSSLTFAPTGVAVNGMEYTFKWKANLTVGINTVTFFGQLMPTELVNKTCRIIASFDGAHWEVDFFIDMSELGTIPATMIEDYNISDKEEILCIPISWETDRLVKQRIWLPYSGGFDIHGFIVSVTKTIEATDDANVLFYNDSLIPMTHTLGTYTVPGGFTSLSVLGFSDFTSNISHISGTHIFVETTKVTPGGEGMMYLLIEKH